MKRKLDLNFVQDTSGPDSRAGWLLLFIGLAMFIEFAVSYIDANNGQEKLLHQMERANIPLERSTPPKHEQFTDKEFEAAVKMYDRLAAPWEIFFTGLESIKNSNIAIRSIQPDVQTGILLLEGEAKDYPAVLTFVSQLRVTQPFSKVFLVRHEVKRDDPQHPVAFLISTHWMKAK
jgi:hypothetical protein